MLLAAIAQISKRLSEITKRTQKIDLLAATLRQMDPDEIEIGVSFLSGSARQGRIGIGYRTLQRTTSVATSFPQLTLGEVDRSFTAIAEAKGPGSERERIALAQGLMSRSTQPEQEFLLRLVVGELRQGALEGLMVDAVAKASSLSVDSVRRAAMLSGNIATVARAALERGEAGLCAYGIELFRPLQPMLAQTAEDIGEAVAGLGEAALEFKMDGARVQVHRSGDDVAVYSRALNDVTAAVPEVVEAALALPVKDVILDGEVISLQPDQRPQPFQVTMRRFGRRLDVDRARTEFPLQPFWFDLLHLDGASLLEEPQSRRFDALVGLAASNLVMPNIVTADPQRAAEFMQQALDRGHEGVMAKARDATYAAGARGQSWLKVKRARTLDLVVLAAEWGNGRRQGWLSNIHLGARDTVRGGFAMLGKTFKGMTDELLRWQTQEFVRYEIARDSYTVYLEPRFVVEIAFNEIQVSPRYPSGLALRFARVKRYRPDKEAGQADTFQTVQQMAGIASAS
jgi:DNA ligase-1